MDVTKAWSAAAIAAAMTLALASCGSSDDTSASGSGSTNPAQASASAGPASPSVAESSSVPPSASASAPPTAAESAQSSAAQPVVITIKDFEFQGLDSVAPGTEVMVTNNDPVLHTVTAESDGGFDVEATPGKTVTFQAPDQPGEYAFFCQFHSSMKATLVVK